MAIIKEENKEASKLSILRHSTAHLMAQAVTRLYPKVKLAIGPAIENGFYYDFDFQGQSIGPDDLDKIEAEMKRVVEENLTIERIETHKSKAMNLFMDYENPQDYKLELIDDLPEDAVISLYKQGEFVDLCRGPHLSSTEKIKAFKLLSIAGAYWRGNSDNKMLTRIYGTVFETQSELDEHLTMLEESKKRDHRKIGKELDIFMFTNRGSGLPFFLPNGVTIRNLLEDYWRKEHIKAGYQEIKTPIILDQELWKQSGHYDHYKENMYSTKVDEREYSLKPMNCPGAILIYKNGLHSYRDFPLRLSELGLVHRHEKSDMLHGLIRVRCFTQDDAHIFALPNQIESEVIGVLRLIDKFYKRFGFKYHVELSTRPENSMGEDEQWELATSSLQKALDNVGVNYKINEGDGAFYGPKIDFHLEDCIGRTWQCGTIQLDFQMPERFDLTYINSENKKERPIMIHRVVFGSIERFIAILIEHTSGHFPVWLAPVQVRILPISDAQLEYSNSLLEKLRSKNIRVDLDSSNEKLGYKMRNFMERKIPYALVIGKKEVENNLVTVKSRIDDKQMSMNIDEFIKLIKSSENVEE